MNPYRKSPAFKTKLNIKAIKQFARRLGGYGDYQERHETDRYGMRRRKGSKPFEVTFVVSLPSWEALEKFESYCSEREIPIMRIDLTDNRISGYWSMKVTVIEWRRYS